MPDLPIVGGSSDTWGDELNTWLEHDHNTDATHKTVVCLDDAVVSVDDAVVYLEG